MKEQTFFVRDFMHETVSIREAGTTFKDVVELMVQAKRNGIFVVDENDVVIGVISAWDLIEHVVPDYLEEDKHLAAFESGSVLIDRINVVANDLIGEFMTKEVRSLHENSNMIEAATMLSQHHLRQLPVLNDQGKLVGCINRTDLKIVIAEVLNIKTA